MSRPRLLDLFSGAGGAAVGYYRAGFEVVGVDIRPQPRYPFEHHVADALEVLADRGFLAGFDAVHASPPCQRYSAATQHQRRGEHPDLVAPTRARLTAAGRPYVIENVEGSPLEIVPNLLTDNAGVMLCGSMFGLRVRRHRLFESDVPMPQPFCRHKAQGTPLSVTGTGYGGKQPGHNSIKPAGIDEAREVMGIPWMTISELSQAIPPAYTAFVGEQLLSQLAVAS